MMTEKEFQQMCSELLDVLGNYDGEFIIKENGEVPSIRFYVDGVYRHLTMKTLLEALEAEEAMGV